MDEPDETGLATEIWKVVGPSINEAVLQYGISEDDVHRIVRQELVSILAPLLNSLSVGLNTSSKPDYSHDTRFENRPA